MPYTGKQAPGILIAKSILQKRIERDYRHIKQRVRVILTVQVFRNAQVTLVGIELDHEFRKEKRREPAKIQARGGA